MGGAIARLKAMLGMDAKQYKSGMREAQGATKKLQSSLASIGRTMGAAFSVAAITTATKGLIDFASEIRHSADNMNVSTEALQGLNAMALRYGVSVDMITRGLSKMAIAQGQIKAGGDEAKRYVEALQTLGISQERFVRLDTGEALAEIGRAYANATDHASAFAAVADILGQRIGPRLTAFMKDLGNEGLQTVINKAREAGSVIEDELITKLELLGTRLDQLKLRGRVGFAQGLGRIGEGAANFGAMMGSLQGQLRAETGGISYNPLRNIAGMYRVLRGGGIDEAARMAAMEHVRPPPPDAGGEGSTVLHDAHVAAQAAYQAQQEAEQKVRDKFGRQISRLEGRGVMGRGSGVGADAMARLGGMIGANRGGVGMADRQIEIAAESAATQRKIEELTREMNEALQVIRDQAAGGAPQ